MARPALILASKSPRRRALLEQIGVRYEVVEVDLDESRHPGEDPAAYVQRLALAKARAGRALIGERTGDRPGERLPVLAADTAVVAGDRVLGKPRDRADAAAMMGLLSGRTHRVLSGVALAGAREGWALSVSQVTFRAVGPREAEAYWASGEPRDKAGGYAIQGLGALFVTHLAGSYSGVMGLPLFETVRLLEAEGIDCLADPRVDAPTAAGGLLRRAPRPEEAPT